ncbi:MAG: hypothetical protein IMY67_11150 [Bacteroidetes bacterium]|nr:hypothetical protein [Bacteroidota bacterium]
MKNLLEKLLEELKNPKSEKEFSGLCGSVWLLDISYDECKIIKKYIAENLLEKINTDFRYFGGEKEGRKIGHHDILRGFVWRPGDKKPRIEWLEAEIKKLSN